MKKRLVAISPFAFAKRESCNKKMDVLTDRGCFNNYTAAAAVDWKFWGIFNPQARKGEKKKRGFENPETSSPLVARTTMKKQRSSDSASAPASAK
nr:hypothetical protein CFP56_79606 [Quercus suber]